VGLALHPKHEVLVAAFEGFVEELGDVAASLLVHDHVDVPVPSATVLARSN